MKNIDLNSLIHIEDPSCFDLLSDLVSIANIDDYSLIYINLAGKKRFKGISPLKATCYASFNNESAPCEDCKFNKKDSKCTAFKCVCKNEEGDQVFILDNHLINYKGKLAYLQVAKDYSASYISSINVLKAFQREQLLNTISKAFIKTSDYEETLKEVLGIVGHYFSPDRAYIFFAKNGVFRCTSLWVNQKKGIEVCELNKISKESNPFWIDTLANGKSIIYKDVKSIEDIRKKEYATLCALNVKRLIVTPIRIDNKLIGFIGMDNPSSSSLENVESNLQSIANYICLGCRNEKNKLAIEYDEMTSLPNFNKFKMQVLSFLDSNPEGDYYFVKFDINRFELINSYNGSSYGDMILKTISEFVKDKTHSIIYATRMYASDCFYVMAKGEISHGIEVINRFLAASDTIFTKDRITFSFGLFPYKKENGDSFYSIMDKLSLAHNKAKSLGDNQIYVYEDNLRVDEIREQQLVTSFPKAIKNEEFVLYIQPIFDAHSESIIAGEVLVRWIKDGKLIPPNDFIPTLEKNGMILTLDKYVFSHAVKYQKSQIEQGKKVVPLSVNFSRISVLNQKLADFILDVVKENNLPEGLIEAEITESAYVQQEALVSKFIYALKSHGIPILMDDFGSGYSSLNSFKDLDISILKLDYKFLAQGGNEYKKIKTIESIVNLTKALSIPVIAEGVEKQEEADFLSQLGVERFQGYLYSKPIPQEEFFLMDKKAKKVPNELSYKSRYYKDLLNINSKMNTFFSSSLLKTALTRYKNGVITIVYMNQSFAKSADETSPDIEKSFDIMELSNLSIEDRKKVKDYLDSCANQTNHLPYVDYIYNFKSVKRNARSKVTLLSKIDGEALFFTESIAI